MATLEVTNDTEFTSALSSAVAGDEIVLQNGGTYGNRELSNVRYSGYVTIRPETPLGAYIPNIFPKGISYISFENLDFNYFNTAWDGWTGVNDHFRFLRCRCRIGGFLDADNATANTDVEISQCYIGPRTGNDLMKVRGNWRRVTIRDSVIAGNEGTDLAQHLDFIQFQGMATGNPQDVTIRGNIFFDAVTGDVIASHGVSLSDGTSPYYADVTVEENMMISSMAENIRLQSMLSNCNVRNNYIFNTISIYDNQSQGNSGLTLSDNVYETINQPSGNSGETLTGNVQVTNRATQFPGFTDGSTWQQWIPDDASGFGLGTGKGAAARIAEIQAGTNIRALEMAGMTGMGSGGGTAQTASPGAASDAPTAGTPGVTAISGPTLTIRVVPS